MRYVREQRGAAKRLLIAIFASVVVIFSAGCGGSSGGIAAGGALEQAPTTSGRGNAVFQFVRAQSAIGVPASTTRIRFEGVGTGGETLQEIRDFAPTITLSLPAGLNRLLVTAIDVNGDPIANASVQVMVVADQTMTASFDSSSLQPVTRVFRLSPTSARVVNGKTQQFVADVEYSNGEVVTDKVVAYSVTGGVGTIDDQGLFTATKVGEGIVQAALATGETVTSAVVVVATEDGGGANIAGAAIYVAERDGGQIYQEDFLAFLPTISSSVASGIYDILSPNGFPAYDSKNNRVLWPSSYGLNVLDATSLRRVAGSPLTEDKFDIGTQVTGLTSISQVAYDAERDRVYAVGTGGLFVFEAATMALVPGSPFPAHSGEKGAFGVAYDDERKLIWMWASTTSGTSGDHGVVTAYDATTLERATGFPDGNGQYVDLKTNDFKGQMAFDPVNDRVYVGGDIDFSAVNCLTKGLSAGSPFSRQGGRDTSVGAGVLFVPSLNRLYLCNFQDNNISVLDGTTLTAVAGSPVSTGVGSPAGIAYDAGTNRLFVTHFNGSGIAVFDAATNTLVAGSPFLTKDSNDNPQAYQFGIVARPAP